MTENNTTPRKRTGGIFGLIESVDIDIKVAGISISFDRDTDTDRMRISITAENTEENK